MRKIMKVQWRLAVALVACGMFGLLTSCEKGSGTAGSGATPAPGGTTPASAAKAATQGVAAAAKSTAEAAKSTAEGAKAPAATSGGSAAKIPGADALKEAPAAVTAAVDSAKKEGEATVKEASASVQETATTATAAVADMASALESTVAVDKVKEMVASASPATLQGFGDKIMAAIQDKEGLMKSLKDQVDKLGAGDLSKVVDLKKQLESAGGLVKGLKEKLQIVVDKLQASGIDVSKYTALLKG